MKRLRERRLGVDYRSETLAAEESAGEESVGSQGAVPASQLSQAETAVD